MYEAVELIFSEDLGLEVSGYLELIKKEKVAESGVDPEDDSINEEGTTQKLGEKKEVTKIQISDFRLDLP
jgi:hypothetical protein